MSCQSEQTINKVSIGTLLLENGEKLPDVEIAYERVGKRDGDVVVVCHALTGNQESVGTEGCPGWWSTFIGPDLYIDTNRFQVITMNVLGGGNGSTGPTSINPKTGEKYGANFPTVTIRDMVHSQHKALTRIGIKSVKAIIGGSLGGMQVLEWGVLYPEFSEILVPLAVTPYFTDYALAYNSIGRHAIISDPAWDSGNYPNGAHIKGLEIARMVGLVTYRSESLFNDRFNRERKEGKGIEYQVDSYMKYQGEKFSRRFDANSYLVLLQAMDQFDIGHERGGWLNALSKVEAKVCMFSFTGDLLYPPQLAKNAIEQLKELNKEAEFIEVETIFGHDGFLVEFEKWGQHVKSLLEKKEVTRCLA
ncbi:homoserine acetyltransferase [Bacillus sp. LL01]|uniref:homoserine O-acetyltransferase MetX n=1 Tax=Bacillus sp. LL01 TaxID=1665556 RepID=UPI00064D38BB|nr:homoserine O-acetyltransferase [Bacillus sp. LL01]KMJ58272.1 homoserine acetyltransferase [Bacillus sp. LL01]